jgi:hypothetical protein
MKRVLLAVGLGLGVLTFTMADAANYSTAYSQINSAVQDTTPTDTTQPTPTPDTTSFSVNH